VTLNELRNLLGSLPGMNNAEVESLVLAARALVSFAEFWFLQGLHSFEECRDLRKRHCFDAICVSAVSFARTPSWPRPRVRKRTDPVTRRYASRMLPIIYKRPGQVLEIRRADPLTWDMVSSELAATYLVLVVRRRQSLIGSGNSLMILHALRLSPGKEKSIVRKATTTKPTTSFWKAVIRIVLLRLTVPVSKAAAETTRKAKRPSRSCTKAAAKTICIGQRLWHLYGR